MYEEFLSAIEQQPSLLFITSRKAMDLFNDPDPAFEREVVDRVGDRLKYIPDEAHDVFDATTWVPDWIAGEDIEGVVILGNYDTVPSRRMLCIDTDLLYRLIGSDANVGEDRDDWWVWNDDLYASRSPNEVAWLPVSRLPIIPEHVRSPFGDYSLTTATCVWGAEFPVAHTVFADHLKAGDSNIASPPFATDPPKNAPSSYVHRDIDPAHLAVDKLYLLLHGEPRTTILCWGTQSGSWNPTAIDGALFQDAWTTGGVVFSGACWGVQLADTTANEVESGAVFSPLTVRNSLSLEFINRGANAFVGFTALHHVPDAPETALVFGAPLHEMFWKNVTGGAMAPAEALYQAKAGYVSAMKSDGMHGLAIAQELKALWSATCIGLGW